MGNANHSFNRNHMSMEKDVVHLYANVTIGASGAVSASQGGGLVSVVKETDAGQYTVTLDKGYNRLLAVQAIVVDDAINSVATVQLLQTAAAAQTAAQATGAFVLQCLDFAGAAVNPTSGAQLLLKFELRRTSAKTAGA